MQLCLQSDCQPLRSWLTGNKDSTTPVRLFAGTQTPVENEH
jgi:hypothetical protein